MNLHSTTKRTEDTKTAQSKGFQSGLLLRDLRAFVVGIMFTGCKFLAISDPNTRRGPTSSAGAGDSRVGELRVDWQP